MKRGELYPRALQTRIVGAVLGVAMLLSMLWAVVPVARAADDTSGVTVSVVADKDTVSIGDKLAYTTTITNTSDSEKSFSFKGQINLGRSRAYFSHVTTCDSASDAPCPSLPGEQQVGSYHKHTFSEYYEQGRSNLRSEADILSQPLTIPTGKKLILHTTVSLKAIYGCPVKGDVTAVYTASTGERKSAARINIECSQVASLNGVNIRMNWMDRIYYGSDGRVSGFPKLNLTYQINNFSRRTAKNVSFSLDENVIGLGHREISCVDNQSQAVCDTITMHDGQTVTGTIPSLEMKDDVVISIKGVALPETKLIETDYDRGDDYAAMMAEIYEQGVQIIPFGPHGLFMASGQQDSNAPFGPIPNDGTLAGLPDKEVAERIGEIEDRHGPDYTYDDYPSEKNVLKNSNPENDIAFAVLDGLPRQRSWLDVRTEAKVQDSDQSVSVDYATQYHCEYNDVYGNKHEQMFGEDYMPGYARVYILNGSSCTVTETPLSAPYGYALVSDKPQSKEVKDINSLQSVTFTWMLRKLPEGQVRVHHVLLHADGKTSEEDAHGTTLTNFAGEKYETKPLEIEGYTLAQSPENAKGTVPETPVDVTYYYVPVEKSEKKEVKFSRSYVADPSLKYGEQKVTTAGVNGEETVTTSYAFNPETKLAVASQKSEMTTKPVDEVVAVGNKQQHTVERTIRYVDKTTKDDVAPAVMQKASIEREDAVDAKTGKLSDGTWSSAQLDEVKSPSVDKYGAPDRSSVSAVDISADMDGTLPEVTVSYEKLPVPGQVRVHHVLLHADGKTSEEDARSGLLATHVGESYETKPLEVKGYALASTPENAKGTVPDAPVDVTYYYVPVEKMQTKDVDFTTTYSADPSLAYKTRKVTQKGVKGTEKTTTTYTFNPETKLAVASQKTEQTAKPVEELISVGNALSHKVHRLVRYVNVEKKDLADPVAQEKMITRTDSVNATTGELTDGQWSSEELSELKSPRIDGYGDPSLGIVPAVSLMASTEESLPDVLVEYRALPDMTTPPVTEDPEEEPQEQAKEEPKEEPRGEKPVPVVSQTRVEEKPKEKEELAEEKPKLAKTGVDVSSLLVLILMLGAAGSLLKKRA